MNSHLNICFYCADQNPDRDKSRGITTYTTGLLANLRTRADVSLQAVVSRSSFALPDGIRAFQLPFRTDRTVGRVLGDQLHPWLLSTNAPIWHYPKGFLPLTRQVNALKVGTVADTILQYYADRYPLSRNRLAFAYWLQTLKHSIATFDLILTVSEFSKRSIQELCERYQLRCPPIVVTYEAGNLSCAPVGIPARKEEYVVHLASRLPHKRTEWLLREWRKLQANKVNLPSLQLVGPAAFDLSGLTNVETRGFLHGAEYESMIKNARALILPSEIEGFGLPALEAYWLGTPVVYVRATAVEEILGADTPGGFILSDATSFAAALATTLEMDDAAIKRKANQLQKRFSWDNCVDLTLNGYRSLG